MQHPDNTSQTGDLSDVLENGYDHSIVSEIDRLDSLYNSRFPHLQQGNRLSVELESPGLAVIASRAAPSRRTVFAEIILSSLRALDDKKSIARAGGLRVFANGTVGTLMREVISLESSLAFSSIDTGDLADYEWPRLSRGVVSLTGLAGPKLEHDPNASSEEAAAEYSRIVWIDGPANLDDVIKGISESDIGSSVLVENAHLLTGSSVDVFSQIRNCAAANGVKVYVGLGLSHWVDVRRAKEGEAYRECDLFLTDLAESHLQIVHVTDKISLVAGDQQEAWASIFDPRYLDQVSGRLKSLFVEHLTR